MAKPSKNNRNASSNKPKGMSSAVARSTGVVKSTPVRNSAIPKSTGTPRVTSPAQTVGRKNITPEMIAERAYFISISGNGGSQEENWHRAERELRAGI